MNTTNQIYLDYAAATPLDPQVKEAMEPFLAHEFYNPSATNQGARMVRQKLQAARALVAHWLGAQASEVVFTAGGSEANNLAIHGVMRMYPDANIVISSIEHESVLAPASRYDIRIVNVQKDGRVDLDDLRTKIDDKTVLVSIMQANNEIGTVQPVREVAALIGAFVDIFLESLPNKLSTLFMAFIGGTDKTVVADIQKLGEILETFADLIGIGFRSQSLFSSFFGNFTTVFISSGAENNV